MTKPQTQALLEKAQRSIDAASILLREGQPEFAASRSYYAIFYIAEALLHEEGLVFKSHMLSTVPSASNLQRPARLIQNTPPDPRRFPSTPGKRLPDVHYRYRQGS